jgi:hypothetical protein
VATSSFELHRRLIRRSAVRFSVALCAFATLASSAAAQDESVRAGQITHLRGDLYQLKDGDQATVFLVTSDGTILADPLNPPLARWFRSELEARFPGRPVRYVLHSGHSQERAAGAWVFTTAEVVGHDNFQSARTRAAVSLPRSLAPLDRNRNNTLERSEATGLAPEVLAKDQNRDGELTAGEAWGDVAPPETTYHGRRVIELGGQRVELVHPGDGIGKDATVILFPSERILLAPGVPLNEVPESFDAASPVAFANALRQVERLEFDTLLSAEGSPHTLADLALVREYVEAMVDGVKLGRRQGHSVEQVQTTLALDRFRALRNFDARRGRNIAETYRRLSILSFTLSGVADMVQIERGTPACAARVPATVQLSCEGTGGRTSAGTAGIAVMAGRFGGAFEFSRTGTVTGSEQEFRSYVLAHTSRERVMAFLARFDPAPASRVSVALTAGVQQIAVTQRSTAQGTVFGPTGYNMQSSALSKVFGADVMTSLGRVRLTVPVRLTRPSTDLYRDVGAIEPKWNIRLGLGVAIPVGRAVL